MDTEQLVRMDGTETPEEPASQPSETSTTALPTTAGAGLEEEA